MSTVTVVDHQVVLWLANDVPARMTYAGRRWTITDTPTRLLEPVWVAPLDTHHNVPGWRFQATDTAGESFVFDVYQRGDHWHAHHAYA